MSYMFKLGVIGVCLFVFATSCKSDKKENVEVENTVSEVEAVLSPVEMIEEAAKKDLFLSYEAIELDMVIRFGGNERLNGKMTFLTNSTKGKIELNDGSFIYYDGDKVFHSPDLKNADAARFDAYTWMYFLLFPNKLSDQGTIWSDVEKLPLNDKTFNAQRLTFEANTGDAPDDWYIVYSEPENNRIEYVAYIVTVNKSTEAAEADPHAIGYSNYKMIDGVPIAHTWNFYEWTKANGLGKVIGNADLNNIKFITTDTDTFNIPEDYIEK
ncbi:DUF6503 family protein [Winogradskyella vidalii]|uniref:DUF6503 family protein n=1 Tax=Winogradskyella vidalii TaxID=2615024 RepID=UPI0015CBBE69|nr:DUF6503 family protein [Winogradskyella vidalii]